MPTTIQMNNLSASRVSEAVILALARVEDVNPLELSPFGESVNPIALDMLLEDDSFIGDATFQYEGYEITVTSNGDITIS